MLAVKKALDSLKAAGQGFQAFTTLYWVTDSSNLVSFLSKGSSKPQIHEDVVHVLKTARDLKLSIIPIHLLREDPRIKEADAGSKFRDSDDWSIAQSCFEQLNKEFGPFTVDLFAAHNNAKCTKFYSLHWSPGTSGVDAMAHSWREEVCWICPPVAKAAEVVRRLLTTTVTGVLIVPKWPRARFWPFLFPDGRTPADKIKQIKEIRPWITQNQAAKSVLSGVPEFPLLVVVF